MGTADAIRLLVLDADGVLTDGSIRIADDGSETKRFHVRDGFGIKLWQRLGFQAVIVTGRTGAALKHRARELGIDVVLDGVTDKAAAVPLLQERLGSGPEQMACLADDWPELPLMRLVAYPMAVADADERVRAAARFVTTRAGGHGAVREAVEHLLGAKGMLERALALYDS